MNSFKKFCSDLVNILGYKNLKDINVLDSRLIISKIEFPNFKFISKLEHYE